MIIVLVRSSTLIWPRAERAPAFLMTSLIVCALA